MIAIGAITPFKRDEDFKYYVDYSRDVGYHCNENGCDDICRCGTIDDVEIKPLSLAHAHSIAEKRIKGSKLDVYIAMMFLRRLLTPEEFSWNKCGGYYGEEIDSITLESVDRLNAAIDEYNAASQVERLKFVLGAEYGEVKPDFSSIEMKNVKISSVHDLTPKNPLKKKKFDEYVNDIAGVFKHKKHGPVRYKNKVDQELLVPIVRCDSSEEYVVIDGRHKFAAAQVPMYQHEDGKIIVPKKITVVIVR
jgi:hypothetical protein